VEITLKNPADLVGRLELGTPDRLLLVDAPEALASVIAGERPADNPPETVDAEAVRSVKSDFDAVLIWREDRAGSHAVLDRLVKRLKPGGVLWVVTAMRKVIGPRTPAARRLELADLVAAFSKAGLRHDREARITAWHVGYRFVRGGR
jgi:predicted methyltransferase